MEEADAQRVEEVELPQLEELVLPYEKVHEEVQVAGTHGVHLVDVGLVGVEVEGVQQVHPRLQGIQGVRHVPRLRDVEFVDEFRNLADGGREEGQAYQEEQSGEVEEFHRVDEEGVHQEQPELGQPTGQSSF